MAEVYFQIDTSQVPDYVAGDGSIGNPHKYKSLETWIAGNGVDYTASSADNARVTYALSGTAADSLSSGTGIGTWNYAIITANAASKHAGAWDDTKARILSGVYQINCATQVFWYDMQLSYTGSGAHFRASSPGQVIIERSICQGAAGSKLQECFNNGTTIQVRNSIVEGYGGNVLDENYKTSTIVEAEFCTFVNCGTIARTYYAATSIRSNIYSGVTGPYAGTGGKTSDYNAYDTGEAPGGEANSIEVADWTTVFTDLAGGDYSQKSNSPTLDQADGALGVTNDILGNTRPIGPAPDMGAFELQGAGPGNAINAIMNANGELL